MNKNSTDINKSPGPLEIMLVLIVSFFLTNLIVVTIGAIINPEILKDSSIIAKSKWYLIFSQLLILVFPLLYFKYRNYNLVELFRFKMISRRSILFTFVLGLGLLPVLDEIDRLVQLFVPMDELESQMAEVIRTDSSIDFILLALTLVLLAPLFEEFIFRGALQQGFEKKIGIINGIIFTSVFWAFIHQVMSWAIQIFILGLILGLLAYKYKSTIPSMVIHALFNFFSLISYNLGETSFLYYYENGEHVHWSWLLLGMFLVIFSGKKLFAEPKVIS